MLRETDKQCIYCDEKIYHSRTSQPKWYCGIECRAKGQMNISFLGRKATPNDDKYRKKRRGTTNAMELSAIWDIIRDLDEPKPASYIVESMKDKFSSRGAWVRINSNGLRKRLNYFNKDCILIDDSKHTLKYKATKNIPFKDALSDKIKDFIENEYLYNTSDKLKD